MSAGALAILDVGQGDCFVLLDRKTREAAVVDCPEGQASTAIDFLRDNDLIHLRGVIVSHLHDDHYGGVAAILREFETDVLWVSVATDLARRNPTAKAFLTELRQYVPPARTEKVIPAAGDSVTFGSVSIRALGPDHLDTLDALATGNPNHSSVILRIEFDGFTGLMGADAPAARWDRLLSDGVDIKADVFVVPHHGGAFASDPERLIRVLNRVEPSVLVISVGAMNSHQHPHQATLDTLGIYAQQTGSRLVCTQLNDICLGAWRRPSATCAGTIVVDIDGAGLRVETETIDHLAYVDKHAQCARCRVAPTAW